ncbi:hypothetical protein IKP85_02420 [bacterium]|nr:hypothetical protein [bacterium]
MADENTNNSSNLKDIILLPGVLVFIAIFMVIFIINSKIAPGLSEYGNLSNGFKDQKEKYVSASQKLETLKQNNEAALEAASNSEGIDKEFFRPLEAGNDSELILAAEFNEILDLMKANQIKTKSVKYKYDEEVNDNFYNGSSGKFSVCQLDMVMISNYTSFKNFMKDLYKHEHYLDIASVEIVPYRKDKSILIINLTLKLYAEKV